MDTEIDWRGELDGSFGAGPDVPVGHYVDAGRRAVRRRRVTAVVVAATLLVAGSTAWATSPGGAPRGDAPVATNGPDPEQRKAKDEPRARDEDRKRDVTPSMSVESMSVEEEFGDNPAVLDEDGLKVSPLAGAVLERMPNPMGYTPEQGMSVAIRVMYDGSERYSFMSLTDGGTSLSSTTHYATGDFAGWVDGVVRTQRTLDVLNGVTPSSGDTSDGQWLTLTSDGEVESTRPGIVLVEVRTGVDLGADFATGSDDTGAVRLLVDGRSEFAVYRVVDSTLEVIPGVGSFDSLDSFLDWARGQYASGEGMR